MGNYEWEVNQSKVTRAINKLRAENKPISDESVKAEYVKLGGLLTIDKPTIEKTGKYLKINRKK